MLLVATSCMSVPFFSWFSTNFSNTVALLLAPVPSAIVRSVGSISKVPPLPRLTLPRTTSLPWPESSAAPPLPELP